MRPQYQRLSVWFGFLVFAILLAANALVLRRAVGIQINNAQWMNHTNEVMIQLGQIQSMLVDAETAQRGYLYTGDPKYLEPFESSKHVDAHINTLEALVSDNREQASNIPLLRDLARQKLDELSSTISLYQLGKGSEGRSVVISDRGKQIMDRIRTLLQQMRERERALYDARTRQTLASQRTTLLSIYALTLASLAGLLVLCLWILRVIKLREQHAEAIRRQEEWWRITLTSIGDGVIATDSKALITFMNPVAESITGFSMRAAVGRGLDEVFPLFNEETLKKVPNPIEKVLASGVIAGIANHTVVKSRDGSFVAIEDSAAPIRDAANQIIGVVLVFRDARRERQLAQKQKQAEESIRASEARLQLAASAANLGLWSWKIDSDEILANDQCKGLFGLSPSDHFGYLTVMRIIHPDDRQQTEAAIVEAIKTRELYKAEYRVVHKDGSVRWISAAGRCSYNDNGEPRILSGACVDITERRTVEEAVRVSHSLSATARLAHELAHHVNNPLAIVSQSLYLLSEPATDPAIRSELLGFAHEGVERVARIARQLLSLHTANRDPSIVRITDLLDDVIDAYTSAFPPGSIEIYRDYESAGEVLASEGEIRQLCSNLIANAFEHAKSGGKIAVRVAESFDSILGKRGIRLLVVDNGPGIPEEIQRRLFEVFFSTKDAKGSGLGLWTVRSIVHKYGGAIRWRTSTRHGRSGTAFQVFIPATQSTSHRQRPAGNVA